MTNLTSAALLLLYVVGVAGMAKWMTKEECGKELRVGQYIMGSKAQLSDKRTIKVYRNNGDSQLKDGDAYIPGEELLVMLYGPKDNGLQFVFETTNGAFVGGGCDNRRVANAKLGKLRTPSDGNGDIMVIAGWALGYDNVKITPPFMLVPGVAEKPDNGKVAETPDANSETQPDPVKHADSGETAPRAQVEPIKLNLRGGKAAMPASDPPAAPSGDIPPAAPKIHVKSTPVKLSVASKTASVTDTPPPPAASQVDPSEPEGAVRNPVKPAATPDAPAESAQEREARLAAEIRAVAAAAAAAEKASAAAERDAEAAEATRRAAAQVAEASAEAERKAAAEAVAEAERKAAAQAALDAAAKLRASPPAAPADETAEAKKHKIQLEDLDRLDAGEDVDVAIEKMQAMIKEMKKKKAAKENVPAEEGEEIEKKVKAKVQKVDRKKKKGKGDILGVGGKKGASGSAKEGFVLKVAARKNRMSAGGEVPAEDADGEVETETENEVEVEEEGEEEKAPEPASQVRARRSKRKPKPITLRRGPDGKLIRDGVPRSPSDPPRTVQSSLQILLGMIGVGAVGLVVLSAVIVSAVYCVTHPEAVQRVVNRVLRRKEGQDKE